MSRSIFFLLVCMVIGVSVHAQAFNLKELLFLKDHNIAYFHDYVKKKGYSYEKSKYDEKKENYAYVFLPDIANNLHEITYTGNGEDAALTFGTTDVTEYEQIKKDMQLLDFKFIKYVPKQQHGRSVLMMIYTDGHTTLHLYNSYIEDGNDELVRFYRVKVF